MKTDVIERALDPQKVEFITCVNSEDWYSECRLYLEQSGHDGFGCEV